MRLKELIYNTERAAEYLGIHPKSLVRSKVLRGITLHGNCRIFLKAELDHYIAEREHHAHAEPWKGDKALEAEIIKRLVSLERAAELFEVDKMSILRNEKLMSLAFYINKKAIFFDLEDITPLVRQMFIPTSKPEKRGRGQRAHLPK